MIMSRKRTILLLLLCLHGAGYSQTTGVTESQEVYKRIDTTALSVDVFTPAGSSTSPRQAIVFFHGGGWAFGNAGEFHGACRRYAEKGFVTFSFEYRLSVNADESWPNPNVTPVECVKDARSAVRWVRENAKRLNINPDMIAVGGQSVGGQLTLMTALGDTINEASDNLAISPRPTVMLLYSSTVNTIEAWCDLMLGEKRHMIWAISPRHNIRPGMPPAIEFHGLDDTTVHFWTVNAFKRATEDQGNEFEVVTYEGRKHYLGEGNEKYSTLFDEEIMERTDQFLAKHGFVVR
jgi:acetyl esterase